MNLYEKPYLLAAVFKMPRTKYIPTKDPERSCDVIRISCDVPGKTTWVYTPSDNSATIIYNKKRLEYLNEIVKILPKVELPFDKNNYLDYPVVPSNILNSHYGYDYHMLRPVFIIGGVAFFRRYNNDWNGCVMYGTACGQNVLWKSSLSLNALVALYNLLMSNNLVSIKQSDVLDIVEP
jgi:hypothetical protein